MAAMTSAGAFPKAALLSAVLALLASNAAQAAECQRWDVSGAWSAIQDNNTRADFTFVQGDTQVQGNATFANHWTRRGNFDGTLVGATLNFTVYWNVYNNGVNEIGVYSGTISPTGRITGTTYDKYHPETRVAWYSTRQMSCARWSASPAAGATPPSPPASAKPAIALGRAPQMAAPVSTPICERARQAVLRNSPSANALLRQCQASGQ